MPVARTVSACPNIDRSYVQGNIYRDNLLDFWDNRFRLMRDRAWMRTGMCAKCKDFKQCLGGAMHLRPDANGNIVRCYNFRNEEIEGWPLSSIFS